MTSTPLDIEALKAAAEKACATASGSWVSTYPMLVADEHGNTVATCAIVADADFIAAANPSAILSLIARTEAAEGENERLRIAIFGDADEDGDPTGMSLQAILDVQNDTMAAFQATFTRSLNFEARATSAEGEVERLKVGAEAFAAQVVEDVTKRAADVVVDLTARNAELIAQRDRLVEALVDLPELPPSFKWTGIDRAEDLFDAENRHKNGTKPVDYLRSWLSMLRPFAFATKDDSWGEMEKLLCTTLRNYVQTLDAVAKARTALSATTPEQSV